jgi:hypothetical protein
MHINYFGIEVVIMRISSDEARDNSRIKVQIKKISDDILECRHITSNYSIRAFAPKGNRLEVGQVVQLEYRRASGGGGYIVVDELMEEMEANVLEAQHIISNGMMYTSLILENPANKQRIHSLVPSTNKLFSSTNIIITGDKVKMKINNGNLFSIKY